MAPKPPVTGPETVGLAADAAAPPTLAATPTGRATGEKSNPYEHRYVASARARNGI